MGKSFVTRNTLWALYNRAKLFSCRPSQLLDIQNSYHAYCWDEAVAFWGDYINHELDSIDGKDAKKVEAKRYSKLLQLLDAPKEVRFKSFHRK